jgi:hypothetical protein
MSEKGARRAQIVLMIWITTLFLTAWLPFVRSFMDGASYRWGAALFGRGFSGTGLEGDLWFPIGKAAIGLTLLYLGWRGRGAASRVAIIAWLALMFADTLFSVITRPDDFRFRGDTLGIDISLVVAAPTLDGLMLALAIWWAGAAPQRAPAPLGLSNKALLATAGALLPVQFLLLSRGTGQDAFDVAGVLLTVTGWYLLSAGLGVRSGEHMTTRLRTA